MKNLKKKHLLLVRFIPYQHFLEFWPMFQHMARPIVVHDLDIRPVELFAYRSNHIYCPLTEMVYFHHFLRVEFAH